MGFYVDLLYDQVEENFLKQTQLKNFTRMNI